MPETKTAIIIGAGPAGLTAAYELLKNTNIKPIIIEKSNEIGGISRTVVHNGNRIDIGGHRFFSKSDIVMKWWQDILPVQGSGFGNDLHENIKYRNIPYEIPLSPDGPNPDKVDKVMLIRKRLSRIYFLRNFFDYPITLNGKMLTNLGISRIVKIGWAYLYIRLFPIKNVKTLEEFFISRFGEELYRTFFKDYTEKVWGVPCNEISAEWGAQRIKKLSVSGAIIHAVKSSFKRENSIEQKDTETSLIEQFMYPKYGPGQVWEIIAQSIEEQGGTLIKNCDVTGINKEDANITEISYFNNSTKKTETIKGDYFISTMPVKDLISAISDKVPKDVKEISENLQYRDFITVGLLLNKLKIKNQTPTQTLNDLVPDNWIYIQESEVKLGRLQIFNNWSPYMVADINKVWIGLEYFCNEGDELWQMTDADFIQFAINELHSIDIIDKEDVIDSTIIKVLKTYPAYFGSYAQFDVIRDFTDAVENLFLIGRNGMHKYNNQDHSILTAMAAVNNIITGEKSKKNIWEINTEEEYHETKNSKV
ncbi:MAG: hypothetical protein JWQ57_1550 [Mucilaginibacter sp.]|nr:hypothetical protein [Mucilaginibacter sp.]